MCTTSTLTGTVDLYEHLLESSYSAISRGIIFGWWPPSASWSWKDLVQRCTRCLPAVRPGIDLIALPRLAEVEDLWKCWFQEHALNPQQVLWFSPRLGKDRVEDPSLEVAREVLASVGERKAATQQPVLMDNLCLYAACITEGLVAEAGFAGIPVVGEVGGSHCQAASCIEDPSDFENLLDNGLLPDMVGMRVRRAYVAGSSETLHKAWQCLQQECPSGSRFLLRPIGSLSGLLVSEEKDLDGFFFKSTSSYAVLEETSDKQGLLTLQMLGDEPCTWLESSDLPACCTEAARQIREALMLKGHWSIDFARDSTGMLVIMDIRRRGPSLDLPIQLWASRSRYHLALSTVECPVPEKCAPSVSEIMDLLQTADLLWDGDEGIVLYQYAPGAVLSLAIASSFGREAVDFMHERLSQLVLSTFGLGVK